MKSTLKKFSTKFVINNGSYDDIIFVCVNMDGKQVRRFYESYTGTKDMDMYTKEHLEFFDDKTNKGYFDDENHVLWLREWSDTEEQNDTLRHECHHVVQILLAENRCMEKEREALAYQQDYLIDTIRKELRVRCRKWIDKNK